MVLNEIALEIRNGMLALSRENRNQAEVPPVFPRPEPDRKGARAI